MTTKKSAKTPRTDSAVDEVAPDPRITKLLATLRKLPAFEAVVDAFEKQKGGRKFGSNGLKVNDKLFALFTQGTLIVKLPKARVLELVAAGIGQPFDPGHGRLMKEWLTVTSAKASWNELAQEAHAFVSKAKA